MAEKRVTSTDIKLALRAMYDGRPAYFITECKTCSTYFPDPQGLLKFDGLAITKSYTSPNIIGYEIKVSRGDFKQDNKWHLYLQYCNEFYFVVPTGMVKKEELPEGVGLIYFNPDTNKLRTIKKALYRKIEEPVGIYKYIIYSRLEEDRLPFYDNRLEYCRDYLQYEEIKKDVGDRLGSRLAKDLQEAKKKIESLRYVDVEVSSWKKVKEILDKHNFLSWHWYKDDSWLTELDEALSGKCNPVDLEMAILKARGLLEKLESMQIEEAQDDKG